MRKFLLFFAAFLGIAGGTKSFANDVILTFNKTGQNVANVAVAVEKHGSKVSGADIKATLVNTNFTTFMSGSSDALSRTTNSVLAPKKDTGYGNGLNDKIEYIFKVDGMPNGVKINVAEVDVYAMNSTGAPQPKNGTTVRPFDIEIFMGPNQSTTEKKGGVNDQDICTVTDEDGGLYHKNYIMNTTAYEAPSTMYVKVVLTKKVGGKDGGCFAGIGRIKISENFYSQVVTNIKPYMDAEADGYFKLTPTGKTAVQDAGYNANATYYDEVQYNAMLTAMNANIKLPATGFYYIRNFTESSNYICFSNNTLQHSTAKSDDANYVVKLIKTETGDKTYKMSLQGKYVGARTAGNTAFPCDITNEDEAEVFNLGINVGKIGFATFAGQHSNGGGDQAGGLNAGAQGVVNYRYEPANIRSWWTITDATTIQRDFDESGYLTLNYPFNIEKPSGVEFYDATGISANEVTMTVVSGNVLAANHPVIARRLAGAGTVGFNITTADGIAKPVASILKGTLGAAAPAPDEASKAYILVGNTAADTRFAKLDEADAVISANRAYLIFAGGGSVRELGLNFGVTAIKGVAEGVQKQDSVFDLQGRRVEKPAKGLYIVNGKKVLFNLKS